jgi:hypothetical protein
MPHDRDSGTFTQVSGLDSVWPSGRCRLLVENTRRSFKPRSVSWWTCGAWPQIRLVDRGVRPGLWERCTGPLATSLYLAEHARPWALVRVGLASFGAARLDRVADWTHNYHGSMNGMGGFRMPTARVAELRAGTRPSAFHQTAEAQRLRSAPDMHDLGVKLYRQRMRREHPDANRREIERLGADLAGFSIA